MAGWFAAAFPWLLGAVVTIAIVGAAYSYIKEKKEKNKPLQNKPKPEEPKVPDKKCAWCQNLYFVVVTLKPCNHTLCGNCYNATLKSDSKCFECGSIVGPQPKVKHCVNCESANLVQCRPCTHELFCVECVKMYIELGGSCLQCPEKVTAYI